MLQEPLFQKNILATIVRNFGFYLSYTNWFYYGLGIISTVTVAVWLLKITKADKQTYLFANGYFPLNQHSAHIFAGIIYCFLTFGIYIINTFYQEASLFNNYDLINVNNTSIFSTGVAAVCNMYRINPLNSFDTNIIYAITHNYQIINIYIIAKQALVLWLLYCFLSDIQVQRRLLIIGTLTLIPAFFWVNNIIFPEQNLLIFMLSGFIFLRKYTQKGLFRYLWLSVFFTVLAIYIKELAVIFYGALLIYCLLCYIYQEKINLSNIFRPWKLAHSFPFEFTTFLALGSFALFYLFTTLGIDDNVYVTMRRLSFSELFRLYIIEIILTITGWLTFAKKIIYKEKFEGTIFNEGLLFAATGIILFLLFLLQISPGMSHSHKSYYAILCSTFSLVYTLRNLKSNKAIILFLTLIISISLIINYQNLSKENGKHYKEVAEFISSRLETSENITICIAKNAEENPWIYESWSSAYSYYFPNKNIIFKFDWLNQNYYTNMQTYRQYYLARKMTKISPKPPAEGDYYIAKKTSPKYEKDIKDIQNFNYQKVFENKIFEIYILNSMKEP